MSIHSFPSGIAYQLRYLAQVEAKLEAAHAATMALAEALTRSTFVPGNDTVN